MAADGGQGWPARFARRFRPPPGGGEATRAPSRHRRGGIVLLHVALAFQTISALFFVGELWSEVLGLRTTPIPWAWQEYIEVLASLGLVTGAIVSGVFLRHALRRIGSMRRQIDAAAGNFRCHLSELFASWGLSPSEEAVAIYAMKGFSNAEIAALRGTSVSTIKSQANAVYRKTGFGNRRELISFLVEELLAGVAAEPPESRPPAAGDPDAGPLESGAGEAASESSPPPPTGVQQVSSA